MTTISSPVRRPGRPPAGAVVRHAILIAVALLCLFPFVFSVLASFKSPEEILGVPPTFLPQQWTIASYLELWNTVPVAQYFGNTLLYSGVSTFAALLSSSAAAYVFAKYRFRGKNQLFVVLLASLMVPFSAILVPLFLMVSRFGWIDTRQGIIIPTMFTTFGIFMMRQFIEGLPDEVIEAARLDGASESRLFVSIILPLVVPALVVLGILVFFAQWDSFLWPLTAITSDDLINLPVAISALAAEHGPRYDLQLTASVITNVPVLIIFALAQRRLTQGIALTGGK